MSKYTRNRSVLPEGSSFCFQTTGGRKPCERHAHRVCNPGPPQGTSSPSRSNIATSFQCMGLLTSETLTCWKISAIYRPAMLYNITGLQFRYDWTICYNTVAELLSYTGTGHISDGVLSRQVTYLGSLSFLLDSCQTRTFLLNWMMSPCFRSTSPWTSSPFTVLFTLSWEYFRWN